MTHKLDSVVNQEAQFQIGTLESGQMFRAARDVKVPGFDAREFRQVIHHLLLSCDVVVYEGGSLQRSLSETTQGRGGENNVKKKKKKIGPIYLYLDLD